MILTDDELHQIRQSIEAQAGLNEELFRRCAGRVKILKDLTIGKDRKNKWRLVAGFQQQDIVFFNPGHQIEMADVKSKVRRIDKYDKSDKTPLNIAEQQVNQVTSCPQSPG